MARHNRIKPRKDGALYHVMSRTAQQLFLFSPETIRSWIYQRILDLAGVYYVSLHAVCVLENHYHVVLSMQLPELVDRDLEARFNRYKDLLSKPRPWWEWETEVATDWYRRLTDLSSFMKDLNQSIAAYVNAKNDKKGAVVGDR